jgi:hypothetical protein
MRAADNNGTPQKLIGGEMRMAAHGGGVVMVVVTVVTYS